jgi:hypothetical protein
MSTFSSNPNRPDLPEQQAPEVGGQPESSSPRPGAGRFEWPLILALLLVAAAVIPRSLLIARAHSETVDADFHIIRGLAYWTRTIAAKDLMMNDPPLGEGLVALPVLASNWLEGRPLDDDQIYNQPGRPERLSARCAVWNSILFLPLVGVLFVWCRRLYGQPAAWLTTAMLAVEPNFAAHIPLTTLDVVGLTGIVIGCFLAWRYFERPTTGRLVALGVGTGVALMLKHTAVMLPPLIFALAGLWWVVKPWREGESLAAWRGRLPGRLKATSLAAAVAVGTIMLLTLFEMCPPKSPTSPTAAIGMSTEQRSRFLRIEEALHLESPWPGGTYLRAFRSGFGHGVAGHPCYLFGEERSTGWWYYFPATATYKVPIGIGVVFGLGLLSVGWTRPRWEEWGLWLPFLAWALFMMNSKVNIGYRHFLPAYLFAMALAGRCLVGASARRSAGAWCAVAFAAVHAASYHPDYLCYMNAPRDKPYLDISDSNVDWNQGLKQARAWLDSRPPGLAGRPVWLRNFGDDGLGYYLGNRVVSLGDDDPSPTRGLLIISPIYVAGPYGPPGAYTALQPFEPDAVIGHGLLVYDLDRLGAGSPFRCSAAPPSDPTASR